MSTVKNSVKDDRKSKLIAFCMTPRTRAEMMDYIGITNVKYFRVNYLVPLQKEGRIRKVNLEHPTSRHQKYISISE